MEFEDVIRARYSVRKYSDRPVEDWKIQKILEAARLAPTGKNKQCQRICVLRSPEAVKRISDLCVMIFGAPAVMLVFAKKGESWMNRFTGRDIAETDTSIVTDHMMLQATALGLGTCWAGCFDPGPICEAFGIPDDLALMHILPLGYAAEGCEPGRSISKGRRRRSSPLSCNRFLERTTSRRTSSWETPARSDALAMSSCSGFHFVIPQPSDILTLTSP